MPTIALLLLSLIFAAGTALGQDAGEPTPPEPAPLLTLDAVSVEPDHPAKDTLCRLRVRLSNHGERPASLLGFEVRVAGRRLEAYDDDLFMVAIPPRGEEEVALFNFWSSESGRPFPADGRLEVEVTLREAHWIEAEGKGAGSDDGVGSETWRVLGAVDGLPVTRRQVVTTTAARSEESSSKDNPGEGGG